MATSSGKSIFFLPAMSLIADRKHVDQPAANNCSGLVPLPGLFGSVNLTSRRPSSVRELPPSRPPVVWALAVYNTLSSCAMFGCCSEAVLVADCSMIVFLRFLTKCERLFFEINRRRVHD